MTRLMLVGATGLVGQAVLQQALADPAVAQVVAPTRKALAPHPKLLNPLVDFERLPEDADWWAVDAVVCTLGTTIAKAGSQAAFYKVDHDHPLEVAYVFYARIKGETERDLQAVGYPSLTLVRPGLIGGVRLESRPAEQLAVRISQWVQPLLPRRYRVVPAQRIAHHLLQAALAATPGVHVLPSEVLL